MILLEIDKVRNKNMHDVAIEFKRSNQITEIRKFLDLIRKDWRIISKWKIGSIEWERSSYTEQVRFDNQLR